VGDGKGFFVAVGTALVAARGGLVGVALGREVSATVGVTDVTSNCGGSSPIAPDATIKSFEPSHIACNGGIN